MIPINTYPPVWDALNRGHGGQDAPSVFVVSRPGQERPITRGADRAKRVLP